MLTGACRSEFSQSLLQSLWKTGGFTTEMVVNRLLIMAFSTFISALSLRGVYGVIVCEKLPMQVCAFSVAYPGTRCVLEKSILRDDDVQYECQDRNGRIGQWKVGMSSDALIEGGFTRKLCSPQCYNNCSNIIDLCFNLAAGEGIYLPLLCEAHRSKNRRAMSQMISGFSSITTELCDVDPALAPLPVSSFVRQS